MVGDGELQGSAGLDVERADQRLLVELRRLLQELKPEGRIIYAERLRRFCAKNKIKIEEGWV